MNFASKAGAKVIKLYYPANVFLRNNNKNISPNLNILIIKIKTIKINLTKLVLRCKIQLTLTKTTGFHGWYVRPTYKFRIYFPDINAILNLWFK
jgi:hypothetical protein